MKAVIGRQDIPGLVIIGIIGLGLTFLGYVKIRKAAESTGWPVTTATVTGSEVGGGTRYYPSVTYTYTVDGAVYSSNRISNINFSTRNRSVVEEFLKKYPLDSETEVHYDSLKPSEAILEPGTNPGHFFLLAFGIVLMAIPVLTVIFLKRSGENN